MSEPTIEDPRRHDPHRKGYLSYGGLTHNFQGIRPCPRCKEDERPRNATELCAACKVDPEYLAARRRRQNKTKREGYQRRKDGATLPTGRPKNQIGGAYVWAGQTITKVEYGETKHAR